MLLRLPVVLVLLSAMAASICAAPSSPPGTGVRKVKDLVIYENPRFYSSFPSVVRKKDGELITAFRRAPERRAFGESGTSHTDPNSYLVFVRSKDDGLTWSPEPELMWAHPQGGSQDPCMLQLRDGTILCSSYAWALVNADAVSKIKSPQRLGNFVFMGGFFVKSEDGGNKWVGPIIPPTTPGEVFVNQFNEPVPAFNRGAMCEGKDGRIFWVAAARTRVNPNTSGTHLFISGDKGNTWNYSCPVATDEKITFNETSIYETPKGDLVAFMRTGGFNDHTCIARSVDSGRSFQKWQDSGWKGHPHYALQLPDKRVLLVYGYRHQPFGIRARILNSECTDISAAEEFVIRDDGGSSDIGYPWATMISNNEALVVYYFNKESGTRFIAGTVLRFD